MPSSKSKEEVRAFLLKIEELQDPTLDNFVADMLEGRSEEDLADEMDEHSYRAESEITSHRERMRYWSERAEEFRVAGHWEEQMKAMEAALLACRALALVTNQQWSETKSSIATRKRKVALSKAGKGNDRFLKHREWVSAEALEEVMSKPRHNQATAFMWKLKKEYDERNTPDEERLAERTIKERFMQEREKPR